MKRSVLKVLGVRPTAGWTSNAVSTYCMVTVFSVPFTGRIISRSLSFLAHEPSNQRPPWESHILPFKLQPLKQFLTASGKQWSGIRLDICWDLCGNTLPTNHLPRYLGRY